MPELPSSSIATPVVNQPAKAKTADDINDMFKELDSEEPQAPPEKRESKPKEEKEELPEEDDELELKEPKENEDELDLETKDEQVEDLEIDAPPRKKEILAKYPDIFKTFPFLEKMIYRDKQYTELFGSFDDAKEVAEASERLSSLESQLLSGNTEEILREVKSSDEKAFNIIVDDYLPTLLKVDKDAYFHVVGNLNKRLIMEMVAEANNTDDDDLKQAALIVNRFVFGSAKFTPPANRVEKRDESKPNEVETERLSFLKERFEIARDELQTQSDNTLRATIASYIDPKGSMSSYVKKNAVADAMKLVSEAIASNPETVKALDKLWRAAFEAKFDKPSLDKIKVFYLGRAKGNLKSAILKARAEALKDSAPRKKETEETEVEEQPQTRRRIITGRPSQSQRGKTGGPQKGESVTDFFMRD